jgi:hypothetical protein
VQIIVRRRTLRMAVKPISVAKSEKQLTFLRYAYADAADRLVTTAIRLSSSSCTTSKIIEERFECSRCLASGHQKSRRGSQHQRQKRVAASEGR